MRIDGWWGGRPVSEGGCCTERVLGRRASAGEVVRRISNTQVLKCAVQLGYRSEG